MLTYAGARSEELEGSTPSLLRALSGMGGTSYRVCLLSTYIRQMLVELHTVAGSSPALRIQSVGSSVGRALTVSPPLVVGVQIQGLAQPGQSAALGMRRPEVQILHP